MLIEGRFLGYNKKYIIKKHKEENDEPLLFFGFEDKTHCVSYNFVHGNTQTKLVKIKKIALHWPCSWHWEGVQENNPQAS